MLRSMIFLNTFKKMINIRTTHNKSLKIIFKRYLIVEQNIYKDEKRGTTPGMDSLSQDAILKLQFTYQTNDTSSLQRNTKACETFE